MHVKNRMIKEIRVIAMGAILGAWALSLPGMAAADETAKFKESESSYYSDLFDQNIYNEGVNQLDFGRWGRKLSGKALPSKNVNIFDEVPDSGFFTNRHGRERLSASALEKGYQETSGPDLSRPLEVAAAEQRGINPRFLVKDARGEEYLLEFDPLGNLELVTGAEVVASRFYHALGYFVPQVTILLTGQDQFRVASGATTWEDTGFKKPLTQERLEEYLLVLPRNEKGLFRASASKILKGGRLGSFSFESRRKDDPADLVNHRDRREIRALGIFASWLNHYDLRASDTLEISVEEKGAFSFKHYLGDFSGTLGATQQGPKAVMLGYEHAIDYGETVKTILALGFREKPWQKKQRLDDEKKPHGSRAVGYFTNELFDPAAYKTQFPYEAFRIATRADGFWASKLLLSFSDEDIRAMVKAGEYSDPEDGAVIARTLIERRNLIARYWLTRANPLDQFSFEGGKLFFKDLAIEQGFSTQPGTVYHAEVFGKDPEGKGQKFESTEPVFNLQGIPSSSEVKAMIRVARASSKELSPAVTILLRGSEIRGIRRED